MEMITPNITPDPRSGISLAQREANYRSMLDLQEMQEAATHAVELIVRTRDDVKVIDQLISQQENHAEDESLVNLGKQGASLVKNAIDSGTFTNYVKPKYGAPGGSSWGSGVGR